LLNTVLGTLSSGVAASTSSYESIASATGTGSSGTITFSSIPSTYKHLQIRGLARSTEAAGTSNLYIKSFNSDAGTNYAHHRLTGNGSIVTANGQATQSDIILGQVPAASSSANLACVFIIDILDYASTSKYKTIRAFAGQDTNNAFNGQVGLYSGLWQSTSALTALSLSLDGGSFNTISTFALYGIKG
jgi:hypothetical protein